MIFLNFQSFFLKGVKKYGCRGTLRFEEEHGGAFPMYPYCCLHTPDQAMQQQAKRKRASGRPFSPQAKGPEDMWPNLRNLLGQNPLLTQARHSGGSHLACLQCRLEWEAPEPTGVVWGQVLALTSQYGVSPGVFIQLNVPQYSWPQCFSPQISYSLITLPCKTSR